VSYFYRIILQQLRHRVINIDLDSRS